MALTVAIDLLTAFKLIAPSSVFAVISPTMFRVIWAFVLVDDCLFPKCASVPESTCETPVLARINALLLLGWI